MKGTKSHTGCVKAHKAKEEDQGRCFQDFVSYCDNWHAWAIGQDNVA